MRCGGGVFLIVLLAFAVIGGGALAERADGADQRSGLLTSEYREPAAAIISLLTAAAPPERLLHTESGRVALLYREAVIPMERLARPRLGLAGYRFDPVSYLSEVADRVSRIEILSADEPADREPVTWLPGAGAVLDFVSFSPDGSRLAAVVIADGPSRLVLFDVATGREQVLDVPINPAWGAPCRWVGRDELLCRVIPGDRGAVPPAAVVPVLVEHLGGPAPTRTYSDLLETAHDDALFEFYYTVSLAYVDRTGSWRNLVEPRGLISDLEPSPDGDFAVIARKQPPYPRLVPARYFPSVVEAWNLSDAQRLYASEPIGFGVEVDGDEPPAPRRSLWKPGVSNTLGFIRESRDADGKRIDQWLAISAPFGGEPVEVAHSEVPIRAFGWTSAGTPWFSTRGERAGEVVFYAVGEGGPTPIWSGIAAQGYGNPGKALRADGADGPVLEADGRIFLAGEGLTEDGPRPFLDIFDLGQRTSQRVFTADPGVYEMVLGLLDPGPPLKFITSRETETEPPNLYVMTGTQRRPMRTLPSPYPALANVTRRTVNYERADGVPLSATLYLPEGRTEGERLPTLIWLYPHDFSDRYLAEEPDIRTFKFHSVVGVSPLATVVAGYALLFKPSVPIIEGETGPSERYIPQLVESAEAAVDYLVSSGITDPDRVAVGGHSYGAFSAANLAVNSDRFATAIAMSGAYNRTLTPYGFQHEKRSFWEIPEFYTRISPFFHADKVKIPILLVHGGSDQNPGTPSLQSQRFFHALVGEGVPTRYVELPYEGHNYRARENVLQVGAEIIDWLDRTIGASKPEAAGR